MIKLVLNSTGLLTAVFDARVWGCAEDKRENKEKEEKYLINRLYRHRQV